MHLTLSHRVIAVASIGCSVLFLLEGNIAKSKADLDSCVMEYEMIGEVRSMEDVCRVDCKARGVPVWYKIIFFPETERSGSLVSLVF